MTKEELIKKSIENNIVDCDAVFQNIISSKIKKPKKLFRPKVVAVLCLCFIIVSMVAILPFQLLNNDYQKPEKQNSDDVSENKVEEIISDITCVSETAVCTNEGLNYDKIYSNQNDLYYNLEEIILTIDSYFCVGNALTEYNSDTESVPVYVPVYVNKHDGSKFDSYIYKTYLTINKNQAYQQALDGKYTKEIILEQSVLEWEISDIVYLSKDNCNYYLPFYVVLFDESAYFVPAIKDNYSINSN